MAVARNINRRDFCSLAATSLVALAAGSACSHIGGPMGDGRLTARPRSNVKTTATGQVTLNLDQNRNAILQVPPNAGSSPLPLLLMLHGATQRADDMFWYLGSAPDEAGVVILAPNAREVTW